MSFPLILRLLVFSLVASAFLPVWLSGEVPLLGTGMFLAGLVVAFVRKGRLSSNWGPRILTAVVVVGFLAALILGIRTGDWLRFSILFAMLATVARGWQLETSRHYFQFIGLSFLLLIAGSVVNPDLYFAIFFIVYNILFVWSLTYTHLLEKVEVAEGQTSMMRWASKLVSGRFLLGSSVLALALLVSSLLIFFLFPRLGLGFFSAQTRRGDQVAGFADEIQLGHFGTIADSQRVILRIEPREGTSGALPDASSLYLRGMAFDRYGQGTWRRSTDQRHRLPPAGRGFRRIPREGTGEVLETRLIEYDVYQEPLEVENRVLFTIDAGLFVQPFSGRFDQFRGNNRRYHQDLLGNLIYTGGGQTSLAYTVISGIERKDPQRLRQTSTAVPGHIADLYLHLPEDLDPRIRSLARDAAAGTTHPFDISQRIRGHLATRYRYTTEGAGEVADPIAWFLFEGKAGHCEYYASSMVLMLRSLGVPARPVNGFLGAEYNAFGQYYAVTEGRAHSWVEVYLGEAGWQLFDPTPAVEGRFPQGGFFAAFGQWWDSLKLQWYKWMIEYDFEKQIELYASLWNTFSSRDNEIQLSSDMSISELRDEARKIGKALFSGRTVLVLFTIFVLPWGVFWLWRRRRRGRSTRKADLVVRHIQRLRALCRRKGLRVSPGTTLPCLVRQAEVSGFAGMVPLRRLVDLLDRARFHPVDHRLPPETRKLLRDVRRAHRVGG